MDDVFFSFGAFVVYKSAALITLGVVLCAVCTLVLYWVMTGRWGSVWIFLPAAYVLSLLFARLLHWYFTASAYSGIVQALTDPYAGSYALPGVILGCWLAAWLLKLTGLIKNRTLLLDCLAPGLCLLVICVRLSAAFTGTMLGNKNVTLAFLQWEPLCRALTDPAGNEYYRLQVWLLEALLMLLCFAVCLALFIRFRKRRMYAPCSRRGNVARLFLALFACIEIVTDSLRNDSILMRFRFLHELNPYSSFISLSQVFAGVLLLAVFVYYLRCSIGVHGFRLFHLSAVVLFLLSLGLLGGTGEFCIQRYGMKQFLLTVRTWGYLSMLTGCTLMLLNIAHLYRDCRKKQARSRASARSTMQEDLEK